MSPSSVKTIPLAKRKRPGRLRGRRCVRCGKKLDGYRRFFCGRDCRREDYREKKQAKRAQARSGSYCALCGRWGASGRGAVTRDRAPGSRDRSEGVGEGAVGGRKAAREARKPGGSGPDDQKRRSLSRMLPTVPTLAMVKEKRNSFWLRSGPSPSRRYEKATPQQSQL